jgi:hypothetical protein
MTCPPLCWLLKLLPKEHQNDRVRLHPIIPTRFPGPQPFSSQRWAYCYSTTQHRYSSSGSNAVLDFQDKMARRIFTVRLPVLKIYAVIGDAIPFIGIVILLIIRTIRAIVIRYRQESHYALTSTRPPTLIWSTSL